MKRFETTFLIKVKGNIQHDGYITTSQMMRDKILVPLQEMWILKRITAFSLEEVDQRAEKKWERKNTKSTRKAK